MKIRTLEQLHAHLKELHAETQAAELDVRQALGVAAAGPWKNAAYAVGLAAQDTSPRRLEEETEARVQRRPSAPRKRRAPAPAAKPAAPRKRRAPAPAAKRATPRKRRKAVK